MTFSTEYHKLFHCTRSGFSYMKKLMEVDGKCHMCSQR